MDLTTLRSKHTVSHGSENREADQRHRLGGATAVVLAVMISSAFWLAAYIVYRLAS